MRKDCKAILGPYFRRRCVFKDLLDEEVPFYAFDSDAERPGVKMLLEGFLGSERAFVRELREALALSPAEAVMFGVCCALDQDVEGMSLQRVLAEEAPQVFGVLFYNPQTGAVYLDEEGSYRKLPRPLAQMRIRHAVKAAPVEEGLGKASGLPRPIEARLTGLTSLRLTGVFGRFKAPSLKTPKVTRVDARGGLVFASRRCWGGPEAGRVPHGVVWDLESGKELLDRREVEDGALAAAPPRLVTCGMSGARWIETLRAYVDVARGTRAGGDVEVSERSERLRLDRSPAGDLLATDVGEDALKMWKLDGKSAPRLLWEKREESRCYFAVAFSHSGTRLAYGSERRLRLLTPQGSVKAKADADLPVEWLAWSDDDRRILALVNQSKTLLRLYRADDWKLERALAGKQYQYLQAAGLEGGGFAVVAEKALEILDPKGKLVERVDLKGVGGMSVAAVAGDVFLGTQADVVLRLRVRAP